MSVAFGIFSTIFGLLFGIGYFIRPEAPINAATIAGIYLTLAYLCFWKEEKKE